MATSNVAERERFLATTGWLADNLQRPNLRVLECTVLFRPRPAGAPGWDMISGRDEWAATHIPGSTFVDIPGELSDRASKLRFMMPPAEQFAAVMGDHGIDDTSEVVLYDRDQNIWAARVWWMLRVFGFDSARVLDGGWSTWLREGRPVSSLDEPPPKATFTPRLRDGLIATKDDVLAAITSGQACIVNALNAAQHTGKSAPYGRPGHIAGSVSVPAMGPAGIVDPATQVYLPTEEIRKLFEEAGARQGEPMVTYCGGGIAASSAAFAATMTGFTDVSVYDASLSEWAADDSLPMETG